MNDSPKQTVVLYKAGLLRWGAVSHRFAHAPNAVCILIDYDGTTVSETWQVEVSHLEGRWAELRGALDKVLPGGIEAATLVAVDFRSHIRPSQSILHFRTTQDIYDWFVRLSEDGTIEIAGRKD